MVAYGPWVQEDHRPFVRSLDASETGAATRRLAHSFHVNGPKDAEAIRTLVLPGLYGETPGRVFAGYQFLWELKYDYWATIAAPGFFPVYPASADASWHWATLLDPVAYTWRRGRYGVLLSQDSRAVGIDFHPDDPMHGTVLSRKLVVRQQVSSSVFAQRSGAWPTPNNPTPSPVAAGTVTDVRALDPAALPTPGEVRFYHDPLIADEQQTNLSFEFDAEAVDPLTADMIRVDDTTHPVLARPALTDTEVVHEVDVSEDALMWPVADLTDSVAREQYDLPVTPAEQMPKGGAVTTAGRVLTGNAGGGYADWPDIGEAVNQYRYLGVTGSLEYVCEWLPPRYRAVYERVPGLAPLRQFPRDDGLGTSSAPRVYPPPRSQQGGSRAGPGSYY